MLSLIGDADDHFSLYATPLLGESYQVAIFPAAPGMGQDFEISAKRFADFVKDRTTHVEENQLLGSADVFMYSLSERDVLELLFFSPGSGMGPVSGSLAA